MWTQVDIYFKRLSNIENAACLSVFIDFEMTF